MIKPTDAETPGVAETPDVSAMSDLAMLIARKLKNMYEIGTSSRFCDEPPDFDYVDEDELAEVIREMLS
jgi:hypothetical protein